MNDYRDDNTFILCMLSNFVCLFVLCRFKSIFFKNPPGIPSEHQDKVQHFVWPDLDSYCFHWLLADGMSPLAR